MTNEKPINKKSLPAKYNRLEDKNLHNECAILLAKNFGTQEEIESLEMINLKHIRRGFILQEEIDERREISSKYYKLLFS